MLLITSRWGGWGSQLNEYKLGDQTVTELRTVGFEDSTPFIIFACCIWSQFTELQGRVAVNFISERNVAWGSARLFVYCLLYVCSLLLWPLDRLLTPNRIHPFIQRMFLSTLSTYCDVCTPFLPTDSILCMFDCSSGKGKFKMKKVVDREALWKHLIKVFKHHFVVFPHFKSRGNVEYDILGSYCVKKVWMFLCTHMNMCASVFMPGFKYTHTKQEYSMCVFYTYVCLCALRV